jgi:hypothetical protein
MFSPSRVWGRGLDNFSNHVFASFSQRLVTYGLQSAAGAVLHEDLVYHPSRESNVFKRSGHALLSTVVVQTSHGNDIAVANIIAAVGSGIVINVYHPGRENFTRPGAWKMVGWNFTGFAEERLWKEFRPDIKSFLEKRVLHRP